MKLIRISGNFSVLETENYMIWFSYETPIAYRTRLGTVTIRENDWGRTTGKHINHVKEVCKEFNQIPGKDFEQTLRFII